MRRAKTRSRSRSSSLADRIVGSGPSLRRELSRRAFEQDDVAQGGVHP
jgi:hypothetical protein